MISINEVTIAGKCNFCRYFEPNGKPYTSMWLRILTESNQSILIDIPINDKEMEGKALFAIRKILEPGNAWAAVTGQIINRKDKDKKTITRVRVNLRNLEALNKEISSVNTAFIAGDIDKKSSRIITIGVPYRNIKDNSWKKRSIPVLIPDQGSPEFDLLHRNAISELQNSKRAMILGKVQPKLPNGDEVVNIIASTIIPIP
jgi:hypothetical protein